MSIEAVELTDCIITETSGRYVFISRIDENERHHESWVRRAKIQRGWDLKLGDKKDLLMRKATAIDKGFIN